MTYLPRVLLILIPLHAKTHATLEKVLDMANHHRHTADSQDAAIPLLVMTNIGDFVAFSFC